MGCSLEAKAVMATIRAHKIGYFMEGFSKIPEYLKKSIRTSDCETVWKFAQPLNEPIFKRVVSHISTASPKTQRIASRIMKVTAKVGYLQWVSTFNETFTESTGRMRPEPLDALISRFYRALQAVARETSRARKWISIAEMARLGNDLPETKA